MHGSTQEACFKEWGSLLNPSGYGHHGALLSMDNADCMEEETLVSLSATPACEDTSPEELRWKEYQAKKSVSQQMLYGVAASGSVTIPKMCDDGVASSISKGFTPEPVDGSKPVCKLRNDGHPLAPAVVAMPSAGSVDSWSFGSDKPTPSSASALHLEPVSKLPSTALDRAVPSHGLQNQLQISAPFPFGPSSSAAFDAPSGGARISTIVAPSGGVNDEAQRGSCQERPRSYLEQAPIISIPTMSTLVTPSPSVEENCAFQRALTPVNTCGSMPGLSAPTFSNAEKSGVQYGISSLPDTGRSPQHRTISLLASRQVFQRTVIRMHSRRQGSLKKGPRVSFLDDYSDPEDLGYCQKSLLGASACG